jgi:hypothetical protein
MLIAAPVPSRGAVATSPSLTVETGPLANEFAGATVAGVLAVADGDGLAAEDADALAGEIDDALAEDEALADGEADALSEGLAVADSADWLIAVLCVPPEAAMTIPSVTPNATGMARGIAIRAARLRRVRRVRRRDTG